MPSSKFSPYFFSEDFFRDFFDLPHPRFFGRGGPRQNAVKELLVDVYQTEENYILEMEAPGVPKEDIQVSVVGNELTVEVEKKGTEKKGSISSSRLFGKFKGKFKLPPKADPEKLHASLVNGVLTVTIPLKVREAEKKIEIKVT